MLAAFGDDHDLEKQSILDDYITEDLSKGEAVDALKALDEQKVKDLEDVIEMLKEWDKKDYADHRELNLAYYEAVAKEMGAIFNGVSPNRNPSSWVENLLDGYKTDLEDLEETMKEKNYEDGLEQDLKDFKKYVEGND
jgi:DNA integrity scanning protein DisA with diadenylate cyclase activity